MVAHCRLKSVLSQATQSYLAVLDGITLADLVAPVASRSDIPNARRIVLIPGLPGSVA